jgi:hypothetical protein
MVRVGHRSCAAEGGGDQIMNQVWQVGDLVRDSRDRICGEVIAIQPQAEKSILVRWRDGLEAWMSRRGLRQQLGRNT